MIFERFDLINRRFGFVAGFDFKMGQIGFRGFGLVRPEQKPDKLWMVVPKLERLPVPCVIIEPDLRNEIGRAAASHFNELTGLNLEFGPRAEDLPQVADPAPDAGLRKMLGAAESESLAEAGL
ncbi:MAG: hypothetical protein ACK4SQ_07930 [Allorhizobium sp.]